MTDRKKRRINPASLRAKFLYAALAGTIAGIIVSIVFNNVCTLLIENQYLREDRVEQRHEHILSGLSAYATANGIPGTDYSSISDWTAEHPYVSLIIYGRGSSSAHYFDGPSSSVDVDGKGFDFERHLYPVHFADGYYRVSVSDFSASRLYSVSGVVSVAAGCFCVVAAVMAYSRRLMNRILYLSGEAAEVSGGNLEHGIYVSGRDELGALAHSMDDMRRSVISKMSEENRAWKANAELITAISHDIRTPLTSMIGYLGLLSEDGFDDKERAKQFVDSAYAKSMELKYLTDELFRYFLVFGNSRPVLEKLDGELLWQQIISEMQYDLSDVGFDLHLELRHGPCSIMAEPMQFSRVINNLVSNIKKYADPSRPVSVSTSLEGGTLSLCVSNSLVPTAPKRESTKIGLMTCHKILSDMGGSFETFTEGDSFSARLSIPVL